jgi:hypothetical protein
LSCASVFILLFLFFRFYVVLITLHGFGAVLGSCSYLSPSPSSVTCPTACVAICSEQTSRRMIYFVVALFVDTLRSTICVLSSGARLCEHMVPSVNTVSSCQWLSNVWVSKRPARGPGSKLGRHWQLEGCAGGWGRA